MDNSSEGKRLGYAYQSRPSRTSWDIDGIVYGSRWNDARVEVGAYVGYLLPFCNARNELDICSGPHPADRNDLC